ERAVGAPADAVLAAPKAGRTLCLGAPAVAAGLGRRSAHVAALVRILGLGADCIRIVRVEVAVLLACINNGVTTFALFEGVEIGARRRRDDEQRCGAGRRQAEAVIIEGFG